MRIACIVALSIGCGSKPAPVPAEVVAADQPHPQEVAVHGGHVYWSNYGIAPGGGDKFVAGSIMRRALDGGPVETVRPDLGHPQHLAISGDTLSWADRRNHEVVRAPIAGGEPRRWPDQESVDALAAAGDTVWWTRSRGGKYELVRATGTAEPQVVAELDGMPTDLAIAGETAYVAIFEGDDRGKVVRVAGGRTDDIAQQKLPNAIAVRDGRPLWTDCTDGTLVAAPAKGGAPEVLARFPAKACPCDIAIDGDDVFVATSMDGGVWLVRGGSARKLSSGNLFGAAVAVDATHVYWANNGSDGSVLRVKRPG